MANSKIRGITIEIGGDTTKLDKALGSVDKKIKGTQVELREVNKLLKVDPTNTEMLAQKQALLTDAISETKEKLDILKNAESQTNGISPKHSFTNQKDCKPKKGSTNRKIVGSQCF